MSVLINLIKSRYQAWASQSPIVAEVTKYSCIGGVVLGLVGWGFNEGCVKPDFVLEESAMKGYGSTKFLVRYSEGSSVRLFPSIWHGEANVLKLTSLNKKDEKTDKVTYLIDKADKSSIRDVPLDMDNKLERMVFFGSDGLTRDYERDKLESYANADSVRLLFEENDKEYGIWRRELLRQDKLKTDFRKNNAPSANVYR